MITLRGTQGEFVDKAVGILTSKSVKKCVMVAPVAYGKSICIAAIVDRLDAPTLILQPNVELLKQNYSKFTSLGNRASLCSQSLKVKVKKGRPYTVIDGKEKPCDRIGKVTYATAGSVKSLTKKVKDAGVKYLIIDECHLNTSNASVIRKFIKDTNIKNILGVTATPVLLRSSMGGAMLKIMSKCSKNLFSTLSHVVQIDEMVNAEYWSKLIYDIKVIDASKLEFNTSGSEFTIASLQATYDENSTESKCVDEVKLLKAEGRKSIIIYVPTVAAAYSLSKKIQGSEVVEGKLDKKKRKDILDRFKNLELSVVINVEILTTGFDHPELDALIMARPTASIALYYQIIGRITRIHGNKPNGRIVDLSGNVNKFGKVEDLNYDFIDGFGWGLFSNDSLLTDYPIAARDRPNKKELIEGTTVEGFKDIQDHGKVKLWFGKHRNIELNKVPPYYLTYMLDKFDFNGNKMKSLKNSIEIFLKLK